MTQYQIPEGFTLDPNSGLYYQLAPGMNPETGETGQWVTWFYPATGDYQQQFHATLPTQPMQSQQPNEKPVPHKKSRLKLMLIILPIIGLLVGAGIFFMQFGGQGNAVPDGVLLVNQDNASMPILRSYSDYIAGEHQQDSEQSYVINPYSIGLIWTGDNLFSFTFSFNESETDDNLIDNLTDIYVYVDREPHFVNAVAAEFITTNEYGTHYHVDFDTQFSKYPAYYSISAKYKGDELKGNIVLWDKDGSLTIVQSIDEARITEKQEQAQNSLITLKSDLLDLLGKTNGELRRINGDDCESYIVDDDRTVADYHGMPVKYPLMFWLLGSEDEVWEIWDRESSGYSNRRTLNKNVWSDWFTINYLEVRHASLGYVFDTNIPLTYDNMAASFDQESVLSHIPVEAQADWGEWGYGFDIWSCDFSYYDSGWYRFFANFNEVGGEITLFDVVITKD
jgi:hypothetical protein